MRRSINEPWNQSEHGDEGTVSEIQAINRLIILETMAKMAGEVLVYSTAHEIICAIERQDPHDFQKVYCTCGLSNLTLACDELERLNADASERMRILERIEILSREILGTRRLHAYECDVGKGMERDCDCFLSDLFYACDRLRGETSRTRYFVMCS